MYTSPFDTFSLPLQKDKKFMAELQNDPNTESQELKNL